MSVPPAIPKVSERSFQTAVIELAERAGWTACPFCGAEQPDASPPAVSRGRQLVASSPWKPGLGTPFEQALARVEGAA